MSFYQGGAAGRSRGPTARSIETYQPGAVALGTAAAVLAATASAAGSTVTTGITNPDVPRNVTATPGGTTGNVLAVSVVVNGTDINGTTIAETLPAFTAGAATAVTGVKAFKTITSIVLPTTGASTTISVGRGAKIGLPYPLGRNTVIAAYLSGVKEATAPTVATHATDPAQTTATLNSALNGTAVILDFYEP